jgi:4-hydroxy-tetrahydrodipicolinate synthase
MISKYELEGIIVPIITPVMENEDVDERGFRLLLNHCIEKGLHGLFIAGTNGETMGLTQNQRDKAIRIALEEIQCRIPVLCGVMDSSTRRVIENIKRVEQWGGEYAVITPVFYARHSCIQEHIRHFEMVAKSTSIKILIYNIPQFTGVNLTPELIFELSELDNIIGIKESSGNFSQLLTYLQHYKATKFKIFQGITDQAGTSMLIGAHGCIPVLAPLFPELFIDLFTAAKKRNVERTLSLGAFVSKTSGILKMASNATSAAKFALSLLNLTHKRVLLPAEPIKPEEEEKIRITVASLLEEYELMKQRA